MANFETDKSLCEPRVFSSAVPDIINLLKIIEYFTSHAIYFVYYVRHVGPISYYDYNKECFAPFPSSVLSDDRSL